MDVREKFTPHYLVSFVAKPILLVRRAVRYEAVLLPFGQIGGGVGEVRIDQRLCVHLRAFFLCRR